MICIQSIGKFFFPKIFAPQILRGLQPSWSGVIARILNSERTVNHPKLGMYKVDVISRDEERRLAAYEFKEMMDQYPSGRYNEVRFLEDGTFIIKSFNDKKPADKWMSE